MSGYRPLEQKTQATLARVAAIVLLGMLAATLFRGQVLGSSEWLLQSESNRLRSLTVPPPRGIVRDRAGRVLADNAPGYSISILASRPDSVVATLVKLREQLPMEDERFRHIEGVARANPYQSVLVSPDAPFDAVAAIEERRSVFPGVLIESRPKRRYPAGSVGAHVLGYVGEVSEEELEQPEFERLEAGAVVGKAGIEAEYEAQLQGKAGTRYVEVDAVGRISSFRGGAAGVPEQAGSDLDLALDLDLMEWIHHIFPEDHAGAVVVLEVETGDVLALYSAPAFDPNLFAGVLDPTEWDRLSRDPTSPLMNRAVMGRYPPGSTWKLASAAIALEAGVVSPKEQMPVPCRGRFRYGSRTYRCWKPEGHGALDLAGAIQHSCNVYFYQLGLRVGLGRMLEGGNRMGFGDRCGIDLPQEEAGIFPGGREYWVNRFGYTPFEGEVLNLALGQGPNSQTPLKMAQFFLAVARDGSAPAPALRRSAATPDGWRLEISAESLQELREGLRRVTAAGGTAHMASLEHFDLIGKTGTAQSGADQPDHAWFTAIAGPWEGEPEVVVVVLVEFGGSGSSVAAPVAAKTADFYLRSKHGIPRDTIQTRLEHIRAGRSVAWSRTRPGP